MSKKIALLSDSLTHPSSKIMGGCSSQVTIDGKPVALDGCTYSAHYVGRSYHPVNTVTASASGVTIEGKAVVLDNDYAKCGEQVIAGSTVKIG